MARKYARDNRGRFASRGGGATARGGRLKTASGKKRATQTMQAGGAKSSGAIKGRVKRDPSAAGKIGKASTSAPKTSRRKAVGTISEAKAGRIISRIDANRPGLRKATGSARKTANSIRTQRKATDFALAAGARARKQGKNISVNESLQRGVKNAAVKNASRAAAKPKSAQDLVNASVRKVQNQKLRNLNAQIKEAGPNAAGLRLQKLQLQSNMTSTRPKPTAKQAAKSAKQDESIRGRIAEMRRQSGRVQRAEANRQRTADVRTGAAAGSKASFARRPSAKTTRSNLRAERALAFYSNPAKALREVNKKKPGFRLPRGMR